MPDVILDPGHGGTARVGGSSPFGARGPRGALEKDVTLRLARRVLAHLGPAATLTRDRDVNLSLADRAAAAARASARAFVSIHANAGRPGERGCETWVHARAGAASVALARGVQAALAQVCGPDRGVKAADLAVLRQGPRTAACLVEIGFLSSAEGEAMLSDPARVDAAALAIADAVRAHLATPRARYGSIIRAFDTFSRGLDAYAPPSARAYAPSGAFPFTRCGPAPPAVTGATEWPTATSDPDLASEGALRALGVDDAAIAAYAGPGLDHLRPIARVFGQAALTELLGRLRYSPAQLAKPPFLGNFAKAFPGKIDRRAVLAARLLLAIPGHFRELARLASTEEEAHAVENIGWLLAASLAREIGSATGNLFWIPSPPIFVTPFADPLPPLGAQAAALIAAQGFVDPTLDRADFAARFAAWSTPQAGRASPGRAWRLETGVEPSADGPGMPFYAQLVTPPPVVNIGAEKNLVKAAWARRLADVDAGTNTKPLNTCQDDYIAALGVMTNVALSGLELVVGFPVPASSPGLLSSLRGLAKIQPAWELAFRTVRDLGWNDLLFQSQGMLCFRGTNVQGSASAARIMSNHAAGTAADFNTFENAQMTPAGAMDPRVVALFQALNFRWGACFTSSHGPIPDPMHFEYA